MPNSSRKTAQLTSWHLMPKPLADLNPFHLGITHARVWKVLICLLADAQCGSVWASRPVSIFFSIYPFYNPPLHNLIYQTVTAKDWSSAQGSRSQGTAPTLLQACVGEVSPSLPYMTNQTYGQVGVPQFRQAVQRISSALTLLPGIVGCLCMHTFNPCLLP